MLAPRGTKSSLMGKVARYQVFLRQTAVLFRPAADKSSLLGKVARYQVLRQTAVLFRPAAEKSPTAVYTILFSLPRAMMKSWLSRKLR